MLLQKNLMQIALTLSSYIVNNANIKEFCFQQFGKDLKIITGDVLRKNIPTLKDAPYVVIQELAKTEGTGKSCKYSCTFFVGVGVEASPLVKVEGEEIYFSDGYDVLNELMNLIQIELNKRNDGQRPMTKIETHPLGAIETNGSHWVGIMELEWNMEQTINTSVEEEF